MSIAEDQLRQHTRRDAVRLRFLLLDGSHELTLLALQLVLRKRRIQQDVRKQIERLGQLRRQRTQTQRRHVQAGGRVQGRTESLRTRGDLERVHRLRALRHHRRRKRRSPGLCKTVGGNARVDE